MKLLAILSLAMMVSATSFGQTNATDVTITDCDGDTYNLFTELNAGKVIVIGWTMPCATCAGPLLDVHNAVLPFAVSNPGIVEYWMADDFANTNCTTLEDWCTTAGITNAKFFSASDLSMFDYGSAGMPKVVVLGCSDHKVYYNKNDNPIGAHVTSAINHALDDIDAACALGTTELTDSKIEVSCFPNPATTKLNVTIDMKVSQPVVIEVVGLNGTIYNTVSVENVIGNELQLDINNLSSGFYFLRVTSDEAVTVEKFEVN